MKKQIQKLHLNKSKIAHFQTKYLTGGTDLPGTLPFSDITLTANDCPIDTNNTLCYTCYGNTSCNTVGTPRTKKGSPCGNTRAVNTQGDCTNGNPSVAC